MFQCTFCSCPASRLLHSTSPRLGLPLHLGAQPSYLLGFTCQLWEPSHSLVTGAALLQLGLFSIPFPPTYPACSSPLIVMATCNHWVR
ncbi:uncharacterized protein CTRU02_210919 [Colletotrichum truncatum]|uniref:Uncharacterized protein n=1 Tax=Colletotrichum truncatum TaxID=5467 RepID=A0ACC3YQC6_COLTU|nr:uncharacterized protein CTRU02_03596 [Colletotrichum truncatum]KAF6796618.1 hypothetical protein CTRU02_03596 [Colletotrichum truncatum]